MEENNQELQTTEEELYGKFSKEELAIFEKDLGENYLEILEKNGRSAQLQHCLLESYGLICRMGSGNENLEGKYELSANDYPDYYGGSYLDESDDFVVLIAGDFEAGQAELRKVIPDEPCKVYPVENSYKTMTQIKETIRSKFLDEKKDMENLVGYYIAEKENYIVVELEDISNEKIEEFKRCIVDNPNIRFEKGEAGVTESNVVARPGRRLTRSPMISGQHASIGFRARIGSVDGLVTTGHGPGGITLSRGEILRVGNIERGRVRISHVARNRFTDASFCVADGPITFSQRIQQNQDLILSSMVERSGVGWRILQAGQTTGLTSGEVVRTGFEYSMGGVLMTNLIVGSYRSDGGDSGGVVYHPWPVSGVTRRFILGIHVGRVNNRPVYTSIFDIQNALNVRPF